MIRSMTGYGRAEVSRRGRRCSVEVHSLNRRFCEVHVNLPRFLLALEEEVRNSVRERVKRGRINVFVGIEVPEGERDRVHLRLPLAKGTLEAVLRLKEELGLPGQPDLSQLLLFRELIGIEEAAPPPDECRELVLETHHRALKALERMKVSEGRSLARDIRGGIRAIEEDLRRVSRRSPELLREYRGRLESLLGELVGGVDFPEEKILREVAFYADRVDFSEEMVRLRSHIRQFRGKLRDPPPVGRALEFLLQEMNREVNTIGSKAGDAEVSAAVVRMKTELEKIREQIQNIE